MVYCEGEKIILNILKFHIVINTQEIYNILYSNTLNHLNSMTGKIIILSRKINNIKSTFHYLRWISEIFKISNIFRHFLYLLNFPVLGSCKVLQLIWTRSAKLFWGFMVIKHLFEIFLEELNHCLSMQTINCYALYAICMTYYCS